MIDMNLKINAENKTCIYNILNSKYIVEIDVHVKNIIKFESKVGKYSFEIDCDFYDLFNKNTTTNEIDSETITFIIRCLTYIIDNRDKIIDKGEIV